MAHARGRLRGGGLDARCDRLHGPRAAAGPHAGGLAAVREVSHDDVYAAEERFLRDEPGTTTPEARRQVMQHNRHIGELLGERCFAAFDGDAVCAYAKLRHRDGVAQVEDVAVAPEQRGAGLGRLVTSAALAAGLALEPELLFIVADEEDWPRELYGRLGFEPAGRIRGFLRPPPSDPRCGARPRPERAYASVRRPPAKSRASRR